MDRKLREEVTAVVERSMEVIMLKYQERWISKKELLNQFQMFNEDWVSKYGDILPHKQVSVTTMDGKKRTTRTAYAQYQIAKNIADGLYDDLKLLR